MAMTRPRPVDRMGGGFWGAQSGGPDPNAYDENAMQLDDGTVIPGTDVDRAQGALRNQVERRRLDYPASRTGMTMDLDPFFGALQAKENYATSRGKRMNVDLMGQGPGSGTGFGRWEANVDGGNDVNLDEAGGGQSLADAQAAAQADRAVQQQRQDMAVRPAPYSGPFSQQGPSPQVSAMAGPPPPPARRAVAPPPTVRRTTGSRRPTPQRPPGQQIYTLGGQ